MYTDLSLPKIKRVCELLKESAVTYIERDMPAYALELDDYKTSNLPPEGEYLPFKTVYGINKRYWIKLDFKTPPASGSEDVYIELCTDIKGLDSRNPQAMFYINGELVQGIDINHRLVKLDANTEYNTFTYFYSGNEVDRFDVKYDLLKVNRTVEGLYFDMEVAYEACRDVYVEGSSEYSSVLSILDKTANLIDLRALQSDEFYRSIAAAQAYIREELYKKLCSTDGKPTVRCIGHTHIDVEWLWDRRQTREKIQRSAATALSLMNEYPEYIFTLSQPELYRYLKEESPEKYAELEMRVKEGRWEPEGALYLECDCNVTSGESLVRQLMYGKRFFKEEFNTESHICFLPDVFGYSASMPQILKKADVDCFITSKISWNDTNTMPHDMFIWRGIDGTEIFSVFITGQKYSKNGVAKDKRTTYVGTISPEFIKGTWERFKDKSYSDTALNTYGFGDGGGGPTREMLEMGKRLSRGLPALPVVKFDTLSSFVDTARESFEKNTRDLRRIPTWSGELYLEFHRGTYTTMANNKRDNRKSEISLTKLESLYAIDAFLGEDYDVDKKLSIMWRDTLHNQFHDILPGSSVESVYKFTAEDYNRILTYTSESIDRETRFLAARVTTDGGLFFYNDTGFERFAEYDVGNGFVQSGKIIPPFGYAVIDEEVPNCLVKIDGFKIDSPFYTAEFDKCGRIISLFDKKYERELVKLGEKLNEFLVFEDYPNLYDAWEVDEYMETKPYPLGADGEIHPIVDGERAGFEIIIPYRSSEIREKVWFYSKSKRIDLEIEADWYEKMNTLKLVFPTSISSNKVNCDIQFGHIERPTHRNTSWDMAKFEICAHKWIDIAEYGYGLAVLNDSKYGYSVECGRVSLTCIKCPKWPNPTADVGHHKFSYSLLPHANDFRDAGVIREAHAFNRPMDVIKLEKQVGDLASEFSLVSVDNSAIVIETVKPAEDKNGIIVRLYESFGSTAKAKIRISESFTRVTLTNLLEREIEPLTLKDGEVEISAHPFEIITIRLEK